VTRPCDSSAAAVSRDCIIVFGGVRSSCGVQEPLNDMWMFNLQHFQWKCITAKTDDMHDPGKVPPSRSRQRLWVLNSRTQTHSSSEYVGSQSSLRKRLRIRLSGLRLCTGTWRHQADAGTSLLPRVASHFCAALFCARFTF
jgi:hypothetical protein